MYFLLELFVVFASLFLDGIVEILLCLSIDFDIVFCF